MVRDASEATAATVALDTFSDPRLWAPEEQRQLSMYPHRLIVRRQYSGLGANVIEWACRRAGELGNDWVRIDVWTTTPLYTGTTGNTASATSGPSTSPARFIQPALAPSIA